MQTKERAGMVVEKVREQVPLVHCITNYVTVNDVANALLAIGASPIMSDAGEDVEDIVSLANALVINIGTSNTRTLASMLLAGRRANALGIPVVLDPVGAGASAYRNRATRQILEEITLTAIRGNLSELSFVAGLQAATRGVDVGEQDVQKDAAAVAQRVAGQYGCTAVVTGAVDVITDGTRIARVYNGHPFLPRVTGTGCLTSALCGAYLAVEQDSVYACAAAVAATGIAGEIAYQRAGQEGTGSFHMALIDVLSQMCQNTYMTYGKIEVQANE